MARKDYETELEEDCEQLIKCIENCIKGFRKIRAAKQSSKEDLYTKRGKPPPTASQPDKSKKIKSDSSLCSWFTSKPDDSDQRQSTDQTLKEAKGKRQLLDSKKLIDGPSKKTIPHQTPIRTPSDQPTGQPSSVETPVKTSLGPSPDQSQERKIKLDQRKRSDNLSFCTWLFGAPSKAKKASGQSRSKRSRQAEPPGSTPRKPFPDRAKSTNVTRSDKSSTEPASKSRKDGSDAPSKEDRDKPFPKRDALDKALKDGKVTPTRKSPSRSVKGKSSMPITPSESNICNWFFLKTPKYDKTRDIPRSKRPASSFDKKTTRSVDRKIPESDTEYERGGRQDPRFLRSPSEKLPTKDTLKRTGPKGPKEKFPKNSSICDWFFRKQDKAKSPADQRLRPKDERKKGGSFVDSDDRQTPSGTKSLETKRGPSPISKIDAQRRPKDGQLARTFSFCDWILGKPKDDQKRPVDSKGRRLHLDSKGRPLDSKGRLTDDKGRPLDGKGRPVDGQGRPLDSKGRPLYSKGQPLDSKGRPLDSQGRPLDEQGRPLDNKGRSLDDQGQPLDSKRRPLDDQGRPLDEQGRSFDSKGRPLGSKGRRLDDQGRSLDSKGRPLDDRGHPLDSKGRPLDNRGRSLDSKGRPLDDRGRPLDEQGRPLDSRGRPLDSKGRPLDDQGRPLDEQGRPFDRKGRLLDSKGQPLDDQRRPLDEQGRPLDSKGRALDSRGRPLDGRGRPLDSKGRPLDDQGRPLDEQGRPLDGKGRPLDSKGRPLDDQGRPLDEQGRPLDSKGRALDSRGRPLDGRGRPLDSKGRPLDEQGRPLDSKGRPLDDQGRPLDEQGRPLDGKGRPLDSKGRPLDDQGRPLDEQGRPLDSKGRALDSRGRPLDSKGRPLDDRGRPLDIKGRPLDDQGRSLDSKGRPLDDRGRPLDDQGRPLDDQGRPLDSRERPLNIKGRPLDSKGRHVNDQGRPLGSKGRPVDSKGRPLDTKGVEPSSFCKWLLGVPKERPLDTKVRPLDTKGRPLHSKKRLLDSQGRPLDSKEHPLDSRGRPLDNRKRAGDDYARPQKKLDDRERFMDGKSGGPLSFCDWVLGKPKGKSVDDTLRKPYRSSPTRKELDRDKVPPPSGIKPTQQPEKRKLQRRRSDGELRRDSPDRIPTAEHKKQLDQDGRRSGSKKKKPDEPSSICDWFFTKPQAEKDTKRSAKVERPSKTPFGVKSPSPRDRVSKDRNVGDQKSPMDRKSFKRKRSPQSPSISSKKRRPQSDRLLSRDASYGKDKLPGKEGQQPPSLVKTICNWFVREEAKKDQPDKRRPSKYSPKASPSKLKSRELAEKDKKIIKRRTISSQPKKSSISPSKRKRPPLESDEPTRRKRRKTSPGSFCKWLVGYDEPKAPRQKSPIDKRLTSAEKIKKHFPSDEKFALVDDCESFIACVQECLKKNIKSKRKRK